MNPESHAPDPGALDPARYAELLAAYMDGELAPEAAREVTRWLEERPGALREIEHQRRLWDVLGAYEDVLPPADFAPRVAAAAGVQGGRGAGRLLRPALWVWGAVASAAAVVLLAMLLGRGPTAPEEGRVERAAVALEEVPVDLLDEADLLLGLSDEEFRDWVLAHPDLLPPEDLGG